MQGDTFGSVLTKVKKNCTVFIKDCLIIILSLSVSKIAFKDSIPVNFEVKINGDLIKRLTTSTKYLGFFVDCHFRWNVEIISKVNKTDI